MRHMMVDCETMGLRPGCAILSIGVVVWSDEDPINAGRARRWGRTINLTSCLLAGMHVEQETLAWWRQQSQEAVRPHVTPGGDLITIESALAQLVVLWHETECERVWANGPMADVTWLEAACRLTGQQVPWTYRQVRDCRTMWEACGLTSEARCQPTVAHDALEDAWAQAVDIVRCQEFLRSRQMVSSMEVML